MLVMSSRRIACSVTLNFATTTPKKGKRKRKEEKSAVTPIRSTRNIRETPTSGEAVAPDFGSGRWAAEYCEDTTDRLARRMLLRLAGMLPFDILDSCDSQHLRLTLPRDAVNRVGKDACSVSVLFLRYSENIGSSFCFTFVSVETYFPSFLLFSFAIDWNVEVK